MRRPLLLVCTCLFISIALWTQLKMPLPKAVEAADWEGKTVLLIGQVYDKEFRTSYGEETLVLYLKSILYSTEAEASYSQIKQASWKLSDIISTDNLSCLFPIYKHGQYSDVYCLYNGEQVSSSYLKQINNHDFLKVTNNLKSLKYNNSN